MQLRETRCHCGWQFPGFHICVDTSVPVEKTVNERFRRAYGISETHLAALSDGRQKRWEGHHEANAKRDADIVAYYADYHSMRQVSAKFEINVGTISRVLQRAADRGEVTIRPRGPNVRHMRRNEVEETADV